MNEATDDQLEPIVRVGLLVLRSPDMDRLAEFYRALGIDWDRHSHPPCGDHYSSRGAPCTLEIYPLPDGESVDSSLSFGLATTNLDVTLQRACSAGADWSGKIAATDWGRQATIRDLDGRRVLLLEDARA